MGDTSQFSMDGKVVIVTGGSDGIGRGVAHQIARAGANVVVTSFAEDQIRTVVAEIEDLGGEALGIFADVTDATQVRNMVQETMGKYGRIDALVNVAGGATGPRHKRGPLLEITEQDFVNTFEVNVKSVYLCCREVVPIMQDQGYGVIVNTASEAGRENAKPALGMAAYAASKAAIITLTRSMAHEWGPDIRVNCICPGLIDTPRTSAGRTKEDELPHLIRLDLKRIGVPEDIGKLAVYLVSDASSFATGSAFVVNGGG